jgi:hypothetical protein
MNRHSVFPVEPAYCRVGRTTQTAGIVLSAVCLFFAATFAAFAPATPEERVVIVLFFGLIPALGLYISGHLLRLVLLLSFKPCEIIAARCFRRDAPSASPADASVSAALETRSVTIAPYPFSARRFMRRLLRFGHNACHLVRRVCWRIYDVIFECSCFLIRKTARFLIRMQNGWYSTVDRQRSPRSRAFSWRLDYLHDPGFSRVISIVLLTTSFAGALGLGWFGGLNLHWLIDYGRDEQTRRVDVVVARIIDVESNGNPNAKNRRSSATGLGQFLNETWLELIRLYRPDLSQGRNEGEILELRRDPNLAREVTTRFAERNAAMLRQRGLPVTPGTVYLAHFAGSAGAVAILSAPENADAATVMASADATRRTKREKIVQANPFLERFTVADLKTWADRKMRSPGLRLTELRAADAK